MAHVEPGAAGEFRGRVGQTVLYRWRGLKLARKRPTKTSKQPGKESKTLRSRLGTISRYMRSFREVVKTGFPVKRLNMTSFNAAIKYNYHDAVTGKYPNFTVDHSLVQISKGTLDHVYRPSLTLDEGKVAIKWTIPTRLKLGLEENDTVHLFLYRNVIRRRMNLHIEHVAMRMDGYVEITQFLDKWGPAHVWMFMMSADGKRLSDSKYLGEIALAE